METFLTIEHAYSYGIELMLARKLNDEEKTHYQPDFRDRIFIGTGKSVPLPHIGWEDLPKRPSDGQFPEGSNQAWTITQDEWDGYMALEKERSASEATKNRSERLSYLHKELAAMKNQPKLFTQEEARVQRKRYNDAHNEGGEGYIPHFYTIDEYNGVLEEIERLERADS